ncbi:hypothetical protein KQ51_00450 [Candidatus Izimaplasma bacterium HR1]|jgi:hypothetical protein|uniref:hypothetical protein n=1 Tax=Candidatus Izimoplasma sp. HR1 TaxID=1541959 RepID=UPI0004F782DC|nr:hypothetical protein KQ51_00450 [Candidatus Izimaplasma bacterium HR1]
MRKLFLAILIPVLLILGTPALVATLMYDGTGAEQLPVHLYTDEYDAMTMVYEELDTSITEVQDGTTDDLVFNLSQDVINRAIYEAIIGENPDYAPGENCANDQECYIFDEAQEIEGYNISFRLVGAWVSFYDGSTATDPGRFVLNVMAEINIDNQMTYKTVLEVHMLFDDNPEEYYLAFDKIQIGNLPLPKSIFTTIIGIAENQGNMDLQSEIDGQIPMGDFDVDTVSYTIAKDEILEQVAESQEGESTPEFMLMQELLSIIFDNQLINFDLADTEFVLTAGVSKFRSEDNPEFPEYLYDLHDQEVVGGETVIGEFNPDLFDPEAYLTDVFTQYLFNSSLLGGGFEIEEEIFNKLIYSAAGGFADTRGVQPIQVSETETKDIELGLKAIWFEFEEEDIFVHALFKIAGIDSLLVIRAEDVTADGVEDELKFEFTEITFGKDELENSGDFIEILDLTAFKNVFATLGDVEFAEFNADGDLIISTEKLSGLLQDGSEEGAVVVSGISLTADAIVLDVEASDSELQETLENFQAALQDVIESEELLDDLEGVLDTTGGGAEQEVFEAIEDIQETLAGAEEVTPEQVEDLMENFEELDEETQIEFLETIGGLIDEDLYAEFGDLFGNFDQGEEE